MTTLASTKNVVKQCIKIHSTVVDNGGKIYDMTDKDYENMLSVMPYTSVGKVGFIWMSKLRNI